MTDTRPPTPGRKTALAPDLRRLDERAARAWTERMAVRSLRGARYAVDSESGATYVVDLNAHSCTCPDHRIRGETCKHLRRVAIEISTRRVPPPGKRHATCAACGIEATVPADADPPLCAVCRLEPGDVVRDREADSREASDTASGSGHRLVVVRVTADRADEVTVGPEDRPVADFETNADYPADDLVVEAVYLGEYVGSDDPRRYSFPLSRLERVDDAALVA
ncbi:MAG: SWIM zinc finger family protein [Haloarculaceae archaeon]